MTASAGPALRAFQRRYGHAVEFLTVYVREAHPGERYPQPRTLERKIEHARAYQARDDVGWTVAVDTVEGDLHRALDQKPHSAYFVDREGVVTGRLLWANDLAALEEGLDDLASGRPVEFGERESKLAPLLRGMGTMDDILSQAGPGASEDVRREAPPVWLLAKVAGRFRPLPPLGRGVAALVTLCGGLVLGGIASIRFLRDR